MREKQGREENAREAFEFITGFRSGTADYSSQLIKPLGCLRELIATKSKAASRMDAAFFRQAARVLVAQPLDSAPEERVKLILDVAQYFYFSGFPFEGIEPLKKAEVLARNLNQFALMQPTANALGVLYAD